jgi:c-src tyrosine kinase
VQWSPPEVVLYRQFTSKSDVWSFGICLWELFSFGTMPYPTMSNEDAVNRVLKGYRMDKPEGCPDEVYEIMQRFVHALQHITQFVYQIFFFQLLGGKAGRSTIFP